MEKVDSDRELKIRVITAAATRLLRHQILLPHLEGPDHCQLPGDEDGQALHLGAYMGEDMVGIASFLPEALVEFSADQQMRLRQMGTLANLRHRGAGRALLNVGVEQLKGRGVQLVWCHARKSAFGFYERLGFAFLGPEFQVAQIGPHRIMYIPLT